MQQPNNSNAIVTVFYQKNFVKSHNNQKQQFEGDVIKDNKQTIMAAKEIGSILAKTRLSPSANRVNDMDVVLDKNRYVRPIPIFP